MFSIVGYYLNYRCVLYFKREDVFSFKLFLSVFEDLVFIYLIYN